MHSTPGQPQSLKLSVVLPVHNEAPILEPNIMALERHLRGIEQLDEFEILLVCNGCHDGSERISRELSHRYPSTIRVLCLDSRGLGRAIRAGIGAASHDLVMFYAVDLPFGLRVIDESIETACGDRNRIVIGSKGHADSSVPRSRSRRAFSRVISVLNNLMFAINVADTQGSLLFPKAILERYGPAMDDPGAFFQAQIVIYGRRMGCTIVEIPVHLSETGKDRKTRFNLLGDGARYVAAIVREKVKLAGRGAFTRNSH